MRDTSKAALAVGVTGPESQRCQPVILQMVTLSCERLTQQTTQHFGF